MKLDKILLGAILATATFDTLAFCGNIQYIPPNINLLDINSTISTDIIMTSAEAILCGRVGYLVFAFELDDGSLFRQQDMRLIDFDKIEIKDESSITDWQLHANITPDSRQLVVVMDVISDTTFNGDSIEVVFTDFVKTNLETEITTITLEDMANTIEDDKQMLIGSAERGNIIDSFTFKKGKFELTNICKEDTSVGWHSAPILRNMNNGKIIYSEYQTGAYTEDFEINGYSYYNAYGFGGVCKSDFPDMEIGFEHVGIDYVIPGTWSTHLDLIEDEDVVVQRVAVELSEDATLTEIQMSKLGVMLEIDAPKQIDLDVHVRLKDGTELTTYSKGQLFDTQLFGFGLASTDEAVLTFLNVADVETVIVNGHAILVD
ncbi:MAG: hypothetical protein BEN18_00660 [Epulopiscium sp. Nuni2H_MBin001]|nr:MAG: hypothetical protein BEN18_00660 [Epulopiscium sp. Nuni2H_MBin001]